MKHMYQCIHDEKKTAENKLNCNDESCGYRLSTGFCGRLKIVEEIQENSVDTNQKGIR